VIEEADVLAAAGEDAVPIPDRWRRTITGEPCPDIVAAVRRSRAGR
jgi:hypothetical protein